MLLFGTTVSNFNLWDIYGHFHALWSLEVTAGGTAQSGFFCSFLIIRIENTQTFQEAIIRVTEDCFLFLLSSCRPWSYIHKVIMERVLTDCVRLDNMSSVFYLWASGCIFSLHWLVLLLLLELAMHYIIQMGYKPFAYMCCTRRAHTPQGKGGNWTVHALNSQYVSTLKIMFFQGYTTKQASESHMETSRGFSPLKESFVQISTPTA